MYATLHALPDVADWHANTQRRLATSLLLAALIVFWILSLLRLPVSHDMPPIVDLIVQIIRSKPIQKIEPEEEARPQPAIPDAPQERVIEPDTPIADVLSSVVDWMSLIGPASKEITDNPPKVYSVNPAYDERRRIASERPQPSQGSGRRPIWENVEKDVLGRTILRNGNCYRVLDDPSIANRYAFENFDQYMVYCTYQKRKARELPWVQEIRDKLHLEDNDTD